MNSRITTLIVAIPIAAAAAAHIQHEPHEGAIRFKEQPDSTSLGATPPQIDNRTIVLFDGHEWTGWVTREGQPNAWAVHDDGSVLITPGAGDAISGREFGDFQLHIEFLTPAMEGRAPGSQGRGNSGVYIHGRYEIQVLDSRGEPPANNSCGALYSIANPLVNACAPAGSWQAYDIIFRAPRFDDAGGAKELPRVTVLHNGVVIHNNLEIPRATGGSLGADMPARGPILLQDHGDPVRYRNIWVRELD